MGAVTVELASLLERKGEPLRKWYALDTGGAIEVIAQWRHSPTNAWKPFAPPRSTLIAAKRIVGRISRGRALALKADGLSKGGSSDPYCVSLTGTNVTLH